VKPGKVRAVAGRVAHSWIVRHPTAAAIVVFGVFMAGGFQVVQDVIADSEAERCVEDWERVSDIRRAIPIPGEAIIEVSPDADPARVAQFRAVVDARIREAYPNPDCSLDAARRRLD
jgi:hypothetical protein